MWFLGRLTAVNTLCVPKIDCDNLTQDLIFNCKNKKIGVPVNVRQSFWLVAIYDHLLL